MDNVDHYIVVMGATGSGKSTFINTVVQKPETKVGNELESCTAKVQPVSFELDEKHVLLLDTPGFNDTNLSDTEVLKHIAVWLQLTYEKGIQLSGIIYLHDITKKRMEGSAMKNLTMFRKLCGQNSLHNVFLVTTFWAMADASNGLERQKELEIKYWSDMISHGSSAYTYDGTHLRAAEIIRKLMEKNPTILHIQKELVDENKELVDTTAGAAINAEILEERRKREKEMAEMREFHHDQQHEMEERYENEQRKAEQRHAQMLVALEQVNRRDREEAHELYSRLEDQRRKDEQRLEELKREQNAMRETSRNELEAFQQEFSEKAKRESNQLSSYRRELAALREQLQPEVVVVQRRKQPVPWWRGLAALMTLGLSEFPVHT